MQDILSGVIVGLALVAAITARVLLGWAEELREQHDGEDCSVAQIDSDEIEDIVTHHEQQKAS